jgi:transcriptional regulator with XRE-family HTH domain
MKSLQGGVDMNTRIKKIRQDNNLTQAQFADKIGLSRNFVAMIEIGQREPSDRTISDICRIFDINEDWLRHGLEPMRAAKSREEEIGELVGSALNGSSEFKKAVIRMICSRSDKELAVLENALMALYENIQKEKSQGD